MKKKSKVIIRHFIIVVGSHTLWTYAAVQSGCQVLHIIVEKINRLLVCQQVIFWSSSKKVSKVVIRHFIIIVANHTLWTYAAIHNGSQVVELIACSSADDFEVEL